MVLKYILPTTRWGDKAVIWSRFVRQKKRLPRASGGYIDEIYKIAVSDALFDPLRQVCSDKEHAKLFIQAMVGQENTPKTYSVLRSYSDIDAYVPDTVPCIIKPTHSFRKVYIHDKFDEELPKKLLKSWLLKNKYFGTREKNYKYLSPKIIVEELLTCEGKWPPPDYKVLCIHGEPVFITVDNDRFKDSHSYYIYSLDWKKLDIAKGEASGCSCLPVPRPRQLDRILDFSRKLSSPFGNGIVRVDFFITDKGLKVGELAFLPGGGLPLMYPLSGDALLGKMLRADRKDVPRLREDLVKVCASRDR